MKLIRVLEPLNCSSGSMCDFENGGCCWCPMSKQACIQYV